MAAGGVEIAGVRRGLSHSQWLCRSRRNKYRLRFGSRRWTGKYSNTATPKDRGGDKTTCDRKKATMRNVAAGLLWSLGLVGVVLFCWFDVTNNPQEFALHIGRPTPWLTHERNDHGFLTEVNLLTWGG